MFRNTQIRDDLPHFQALPLSPVKKGPLSVAGLMLTRKTSAAYNHGLTFCKRFSPIAASSSSRPRANLSEQFNEIDTENVDPEPLINEQVNDSCIPTLESTRNESINFHHSSIGDNNLSTTLQVIQNEDTQADLIRYQEARAKETAKTKENFRKRQEASKKSNDMKYQEHQNQDFERAYKEIETLEREKHDAYNKIYCLQSKEKELKNKIRENKAKTLVWMDKEKRKTFSEKVNFHNQQLKTKHVFEALKKTENDLAEIEAECRRMEDERNIVQCEKENAHRVIGVVMIAVVCFKAYRVAMKES